MTPVPVRTPTRGDLIAPIYATAIAIVGGDVAGNLHYVAPLWIAGAFTLAAALAMLAGRRSLGLLAAYAALALAASAAVGALLDPPLVDGGIRSFPDHSLITIEGRVIRPPEEFPGRERIYVRVERAALAGNELAPSSGVVRVADFDRGALALGDEIQLTARLRFARNYGDPGEFDYEAFMARAGVDAMMTAPEKSFDTPAFRIVGHHASFPSAQIDSVRRRIAHFIDHNLDGDERAEMRALVIGDRGDIRDGLRDRFARTGMAHLLVISGLHLSMVAAAAFALARLAMMLFQGLASRGYANKVAAIAGAVAVSAYAAIAGHHVSTMRALVMVLAYMLAIVIDRAREALASLALAAIVICFAMPGSSADIGFQLSFASVIVIILGMRRFVAWASRRKRDRLLPMEAASRGWIVLEVIIGYLAVSFWATLGTAPLTALHFNQVAFVGLVANAVVVPLMGFAATIAGLIAALLSFVWEPLARFVLLAGADLLRASNWLAAFFVEWPAAWAHIFTPTPIELALIYGLLCMWLLAPVLPPGVVGVRRPPPWRPLCAGILVILLGVDAGWWIRDRFFCPDLRVTFLAVGEGDAAVVRFPGSKVMVIDAGGAYAGYDSGERLVAPYLWSRKIMSVDYLVLSHPDLDHFGGFDYLANNLHPGEFWSSPEGSADRSYLRLKDRLTALKIPVRMVKGAAAPIDNISGVWIESLGRSDDTGGGLSHNNSSMVLRLRFGENSFLFTGDIEAATEHAILQAHSDLHATVLKVPHHGSATSSSAEFVGAVAPQFAVISTGYLNRFHFPAQDVIDRYESIGATVLRTDLDGAVIADASPTRLVVSTSWGEPMVTAVDNELRPANHGPRPLAQFILASLRVDGF